MNEVTISVLSDPELRAAGEAILRLTGVALVPPGSIYRIEPFGNGATTVPAPGWPTGDLKPRALRITGDGVDLVMGAEVVEAEGLLPGTPVLISVPAVGVRADLRWPKLPPRPAAGAEPAGNGGADPAIEAQARAATGQTDAKAPDQDAGEKTADDAAASAPAAGETLSRLTLAPEAPSRSKSRPSLGEALASLKPIADAAPSRRQIPAPPPPPVRLRAASDAAPVKPEGWRPEDSRPPSPAPGTLLLTAPSSTMSSLPAAGHRMPWTAPVLTFLLGCSLTAALAFGLWKFAPRIFRSGDAAHSTVQAAQNAGRLATLPHLSVILAHPETSPQGQPATGVGFEEALKRADQGLHANEAPHERQEAKFWLRRALAVGLGDRRLLWALTQLGTLYASPEGGTPDYAAARSLWEIAGARGDPVALCFLASVTEIGLGGARDPARALALYLEAKDRGGCPGVDDAIARLRRADR